MRPKKLSGDYVATDNGVVPDGKTSEVGKMDSFPNGLVVKRDSRLVPSSGDEGMSHPLPGRKFRPLMGWKFLTIADDLSLADDAGGLPLVIRVSELLRAVAEADPLIDAGKASSVDLRRPAEACGALRFRCPERQ